MGMGRRGGGGGAGWYRTGSRGEQSLALEPDPAVITCIIGLPATSPPGPSHELKLKPAGLVRRPLPRWQQRHLTAGRQARRAQRGSSATKLPPSSLSGCGRAYHGAGGVQREGGREGGREGEERRPTNSVPAWDATRQPARVRRDPSIGSPTYKGVIGI